MRKITQQEINDAPKGAKFYSIGRSGKVYFFKNASGLKKPIPRKEFDISEYEFSDRAIDASMVIGDKLLIRCSYNGVTLKEQDSIAIAKHFGHYKET